jgi:large subunit ribosomal protein L1
MAKQSKRMRKAYEGLDVTKLHSLPDALGLVKDRAGVKFDESVDVSICLGVDPKQSDQVVRGTVAMPHGLGKVVRVAVFARDAKAQEARDAGADIVGSDELVEMIQKGDMPFDRCIATPDMMAFVGRVGKLLGPRGLMPNPKLGTVTPNVAEAVKAAKSGQVEFRVEKAGIVHAGVGRVSFGADALADNIRALVDALNKAKPAASKGTYLKKVYISSTMGVGVGVDVSQIAA